MKLEFLKEKMFIKQIVLSWVFRLGALLLQVLLFLLVSKRLVGDSLTIYLYISALIGYFVLTEFGAGFYLQNRVTTSLLYKKNRMLDYLLTIIRNIMIVNFFIALVLLIYIFFVDYSVFLLGIALLFASSGSSIIYRYLVGAGKAYFIPILSFSSALLSLILINNYQTNDLSVLLLFLYLPLIILNSCIYLFYIRNNVSPSKKKIRFSRFFSKTKDYFQFMLIGVLVTQLDKYFISLREHDIDFYLFLSRILMFLLSFYLMGIQLIMPRLRELYHLKSVRKGLNYVLFYSAVFAMMTLFFMLFFFILDDSLFYNFFPKLTIEYPTLIMFIGYLMVRFLSDGIASYAAVLGHDKHLKRIAIYQLLVVVILSVVFVNSLQSFTLILPMFLAILLGIPLLMKRMMVKI